MNSDQPPLGVIHLFIYLFLKIHSETRGLIMWHQYFYQSPSALIGYRVNAPLWEESFGALSEGAGWWSQGGKYVQAILKCKLDCGAHTHI